MLDRVKSIKVKKAIVPLLIVTLVFATGTILGAFVWDKATEPDKQYEYYRGIYDSCVQLTRDVKGCNEAVDSTFKYDWYNQPSPLFDGPNLPIDKSPRAE